MKILERNFLTKTQYSPINPIAISRVAFVFKNYRYFFILSIFFLCAYTSLAYVAVIICVGIPLLGTIKMPIGQWLGLFGCLLIAVLAYCAIFTFIGMLISNRAISTIVSILLAFGLLFAAMACFEVVEAPEFVWTISMVEGEMIESRIPNPNYPGDAERMVCQILFSINPAGQMYQLSGIENPEMTALPLYFLGIITFFTFSGIGLFKRKDLK